jgi:hypothetical protein
VILIQPKWEGWAKGVWRIFGFTTVHGLGAWLHLLLSLQLSAGLCVYGSWAG